jgi:hypothetical protein
MKTELSGGGSVTEDHRELKGNGQQKGYVVLSAEERAKGFVRPVRQSYVHVGRQAPQNLRDLTDEEHERYDKFGYVKFQPYPESELPLTGRFWTQPELDSINNGCGVKTTMALDIAETYATSPAFYNGTFCCGCGKHLPLEEFVWDGTNERVGS